MTDAQNRRADDKRAPGKLQWDGQSTQHATEFARENTRLANAFAEAARAFLNHVGTGAALAAIPNTQPLAYAIAGTLPMIAQALPKDEGAPAALLTDDDIQIIWQTMPGGPAGWLKSFGFLQFARAVEEEVAGRCRAQGGNTSDSAGSAAAPSAASIEGLTRYVLNNNSEIVPAKDETLKCSGEMVYVSDVERLLATQSAKQGAQLPVGWSVTAKAHPGGNFYVISEGRSMRAITEDAEPTLFRLFKQMADVASQAAPEQAAQVQADVRDQALEEAAQACEGERVEDTGTDGDTGYNNAVKHCADAIRAMKSKRAASTDGEARDA